MLSQKAITVAAQCWCDPRTSNREMDSELATVFAEKIDEYIEALRWGSGSEDFGLTGKAHLGWRKLVTPLITP